MTVIRSLDGPDFGTLVATKDPRKSCDIPRCTELITTTGCYYPRTDARTLLLVHSRFYTRVYTPRESINTDFISSGCLLMAVVVVDVVFIVVEIKRCPKLDVVNALPLSA